jgi:hypothetical protein
MRLSVFLKTFLIFQACELYATCTACIADPACGYCPIIMFPVNGAAVASCMNINASALCADQSKFVSGGSSLISSQSQFPINPVTATVYLKPGEPLSIAVTVTKPVGSSDFDIFLIQDLSWLFKNTIPIIAAELPQLIQDVLSFSVNSNFGLASFIDVPVEPFGYQNGFTDNLGTIEGLYNRQYNYDPAELNIPFPASQICSLKNGAFDDTNGRASGSGAFNHKFCTEKTLDSDFQGLVQRYASLVAHHTLDTPQPVFDAIFYSSNCLASWRPNANKLVVVVTGGRPHLGVTENCAVLPDLYAVACTPTTDNYVSLGYFEAENNLDCFLDPASATWQSTYWTTDRTAKGWSYSPNTTQFIYSGGGAPGTKENFISSNDALNALKGITSGSRGVITPLIVTLNSDASSTSLQSWDRIQNQYWSAVISQWNLGSSRILTTGTSTNLRSLVVGALTALDSSIQMVVQNDPDNLVSSISPLDVNGRHIFANSASGDQVTFTVTLLTNAAAQNTTVVLQLLGYGTITISVIDTPQCAGCNGNPDGRVDLCGVCDPAVSNTCADCFGNPGGSAFVDQCGVCGGFGVSCVT